MLDKIQTQIDVINESLKWIRNNKPEQYRQLFIPLVERRKELNIIKAAEYNNPGIAAFGKSQVGKSYLISCLLQDNGRPFMVDAGSDSYNFVFDINPPSEEGGGRESTGVVSRFSSFKRHPESYNRDLPVLVKTFSLTDIIVILADSYFNDFANYTSMSESDINALSNKLMEDYGERKPLGNTVIAADDVLYMKDYFAKHINNAQAFNNNPSFFNNLALIIDRIPASEYVGIFANLWYNDSNITRLYNRLYGILQTFDFARYLYLPIEAVLHHGVRENTIMSVQCLRQLFSHNAGDFRTDAYVRDDSGFVKRAENIAKSDICAICAEVVFRIGDSFLSSRSRYDFTGIGSDVSPRLNHGDVEMQMLRDNDLLDFPGARSREQENVEKLCEDTVLLNCFLRGKVAYLFNKYNEEKSINILLYCHHNKDNDVTSLYKLLEEWVDNYVGRTPEERRRKLEATKVSPLFYIGTMFNLDMSLGVGATVSEEAIDQRWKGRFDTVMNGQCFHRNTVEWMRNWTRTGEDFRNSYMLRDYKFSGPKTGLYKGFEETQREQEMIMKEEYYQMMRRTFVSNEYVRQYFADPALSWDVAASINNDGALYIMENLNEVALRMGSAREQQFGNDVDKIGEYVASKMSEFLVSEDIVEILNANVLKAKKIIRELDFVCENDNYYFGHLLQAFQTTETECLQVVHRIIQDPAPLEDTKKLPPYVLIMKKVGQALSVCSNDDERWECLRKAYGFSSRSEAEGYLIDKKIDPKVLFRTKAEDIVPKQNSDIIADSIFDMWKGYISSVDFMSDYADGADFDQSVMSSFVDNTLAVAEHVGLRRHMSQTIAEYVNVIGLQKVNESFIADILASTINDFVINLGFSYLTAEEQKSAREIAEKHNLPVFKFIDRKRTSSFEESELTALFNELTTEPQALTPAFEDNYLKWEEYIYVSFIAFLSVPDYDKEANDQLIEIIKKTS